MKFIAVVKMARSVIAELLIISCNDELTGCASYCVARVEFRVRQPIDNR